MASSSKRKRPTKNPHAAEYEIVRPSRQDVGQPSATSRTVTFDRNPSGRLGQYTEIAEVEISAEDLAALARDPEFSSLPDDETLNYEFFEQTVQADDREDEPVVHRVPEKKKVKPNIFAEWLPFRDTHVHELIRHDGWADLSKQCFQCLQADAAYKCDDCFGPTVHCHGCVVSVHTRLPFHRIKHWNGDFWQSVQLIDLGLRVQLGHNGGPCAAPLIFQVPLTVYHTNGAHSINVSYCQCNEPAGGYLFANQLLRSSWFPASLTRPRTAFTFAVLKHFHHLTLQGKTTAYDFYNSLVHETDNTGLKPPPKRYNEFMMVMRWWRHIKMLKRAGRGHDPAGVAATKPGSLAVECPACPHDGRNLPENWKSVPMAIAWIYTLYLAMDANFRLKLRNRHIKNDPELGPGWAYCVDEKQYQNEMDKYGDQIEISNCDSGLHAIDHANTRFSKNCLVNGVGNVVCARHTFVESTSAGDLKKGEKFCSMDYVLLSALINITIAMLVVSYDIACQWSKNFRTRIIEFPPAMDLNLDDISFTTVIPKFHILGHGKKCQSVWSLNYRRWMGRTDGEGVEREWSHINPVALSTKVMGPGARHDTLDDHWGAWNWRKVVSMGRHLQSKLKEAIPMSKKHRALLNALSATFPVETIVEWTKMVDDWQEDTSQPNPFEEIILETTQADVEQELLAEETAERAQQALTNTESVHETTASKFLSMGLDLENQQRAVLAKAKQLKRGQGLYEEGAMERRRATLSDRIETWRSIQTLYMPGVTQLRQINGTRTDAMPAEQDNEMPESTELWLPSSLPSGLRESGCIDGLVEKERRLRLAEADDALVALRRQLRITTGVFNYKKTHVSGTGQKSNTRARTLLSHLTAKTKMFADRYRAARKALTTLDPNGDWQHRLRPLRPDDIRGPTRQDDDESEGRRELTWIWLVGRTQVPAEDGDEFEIAEGMRVEWAKTHARAHRWQEEVILLTEETRRVVAYLNWKASWWRTRGSLRDDVRADITDGLKAYANRQANLMHQLAESFAALWYPIFTAEGTHIEWPEHYITYAQSHPPKVRTSRRKAVPLTATPGEGEDSGSDEEEDEDEDEASGYSSPEGDDADVSPYK